MFLVCVLYNFICGENMVGLVIECVCKGIEMCDGFFWFCEKCNYELKYYCFMLENIEKDFILCFKEFYGFVEMRICINCGYVMEVDLCFI